MRVGILAAVVILAGAAPVYAQESISQRTNSGGSIIRTPPSSNGSSYGTSGNVNAPTSTYPQRLRDYNNPSASYGRLNPSTGNTRMRTNRR